MSRAQRLLDLLQALRRRRAPVRGADLARELGVSLRTLYRDILTLQAQGADIEGAAGLGYVLRPGFTLPPLMFNGDEIEALVLGCRWVAERGDAKLSAGAKDVLAKVRAVLPEEARRELETSGLLAAPVRDGAVDTVDLSVLRGAIRSERKVVIDYRNEGGVASRRTIWPFALGYFERTRLIAAWCEMRGDFRHFRTDRVARIEVGRERYPRRRQVLLADWREARGGRDARSIE